jgi:hypothetical protein
LGSDISFSAAEIALITLLLGTLATPIGILFWQLDKSRKEQISQAEKSADDRVARERELTDKMLPGVEENTRTLKRWIEIQETLIERQVQMREMLPPPPTIRRTGRGREE